MPDQKPDPYGMPEIRPSIADTFIALGYVAFVFFCRLFPRPDRNSLPDRDF